MHYQIDPIALEWAKRAAEANQASGIKRSTISTELALQLIALAEQQLQQQTGQQDGAEPRSPA